MFYIMIIFSPRNLLFLSFLFYILTVLSGCFPTDKSLNVGLIPSESPEKLKEDFSAIEAYLEKEMGRPVDVYIPEDIQ